MRIVVNTTSVSPTKVGIRTYLTNTLRALLEIDDRNEYVLICGRHNREIFEPFAAGRRGQVCLRDIGLQRALGPLRVLYDQLVLPRALRGIRNDAVLLEPSNVASFGVDMPTVLVVQGALSIRRLRRPGLRGTREISPLHRAYFNMALPVSLRRARRVVAVSGHVRDALADAWPFCRGRLSVVHEGVDPERFRPSQDPARAAGEAEGYLLFVGTLFPYKNVDLVLRALALLRADGRAASLRLKIAGKDVKGRYLGPLQRLAGDLGIADAVEWLGPVDHERMPALYRGASALVYPSSVESFGLPALEAMACGVPVVASRRGALPEVVGDAGVLVEPEAEPLAEATGRVLRDAALRRSLVTRGRTRASRFTWRATARQMLEILTDCRA